MSNPDAFTPPGGPASFPRRHRGAGPPTNARAVILIRVVLPKAAAGVGIPRSNGRRINDLGRRTANSGVIPLRLPAGFAPAQGSPRGAAKGRWRRWLSRRSSPRPFPVASLSGKRAGSRGVRAETATETTIRDGRRRTRTLSRFARRPGSVPASVPGRRAPTKDRAVLPGPPDHFEGRCRSGYSKIERSQNQRLGARNGELRRGSASLAGPGPPRRRDHLGERRRDAGAVGIPTIFPATLPVASLSGKRGGSWGVRVETTTETTIRDGRRRTRTLFRIRPAVRLRPRVGAGVPDAAERSRGLPGSRDHSRGAAVVGIPRSNGSKINDLDRRVSNSGAIPLRPPARRHPGAGFTSGSGGGTLAPLAIPTIFPATLPFVSLPGESGGSWGVAETATETTIRDGRRRTRTLFRSARRPGFDPAPVPGSRAANGLRRRPSSRRTPVPGNLPRRGYSETEWARSQRLAAPKVEIEVAFPGRRRSRVYQMSPKVKPSGKGSEGSSE